MPINAVQFNFCLAYTVASTLDLMRQPLVTLLVAIHLKVPVCKPAQDMFCTP